jgi:hypothetical protein
VSHGTIFIVIVFLFSSDETETPDARQLAQLDQRIGAKKALLLFAVSKLLASPFC